MNYNLELTIEELAILASYLNTAHFLQGDQFINKELFSIIKKVHQLIEESKHEEE